MKTDPITLIPERVARFEQATLARGAHTSFDSERCAMEWLA
jgi:hypothetical protein